MKKQTRQQAKTVAPYLNTKLPIERRVDDLVSRMTRPEKISQMVHHAKAIERLGVPRYYWWNECLHGVGRAGRATVFPQAIALAATFDTELVRKTFTAVSDEARAKYNAAQKIGNSTMYTGLTFWTPNINIFRDPRWGRGHETYGEDPFLTARMGVAVVRGMQGNDKRYLKVAACAKHYAVHSGPEPLRHAFNAKVSPRDLWDTYLPAFEAAVVEGKVESVMGAYNRTNDDLCCAHPVLIEQILRQQWGFDGHFVSDCGAVEDFHMFHKMTLTPAESAALAVRNGCDLCCGEVFGELGSAVDSGLIPESEIDTAVKRLFTTRMRLGMFDPRESVPFNKIKPEVVDSPKHRKLALQGARESIVLLKNNGLLPLKKDIKRILVAGPNFDGVEVLLGNYNGYSSRLVTIIEGITGSISAGTVIVEERKCPLFGDSSASEGSVRWRSSECDVIIAVMGLSPRIEGEEGDAYLDAGGDRRTIELPEAQEQYLKMLKATGKPVVMVLVSGSAVAIPWAAENLDAVVQVFYPGEEGGTAVADVLFGDYNPSGRLPVTVPVSTAQLPAFEDYAMSNRTYRYMKEKPLFPFGYGLSYTTFRYSKAKVNRKEFAEGERVLVSVDVTNTGKVAGDEVVQLYIRDQQASVPVPHHALRGFARVSLKPKQTKRVEFELTSDAFALVDNDGRRVLEPGDFTIFIGGGQPGFAAVAQVTVRAK